MKTYKFFVRSTRRGLTEWVIAYDGETEVKRIDRDVTQETVRQFRERVGALLEAEGYVMAPNQYTL